MTGPVGNEAAHAALAAAMAGGTLHHAWLLAGPEGVGKAWFARRAAARMLAEAGEPAALREGWEIVGASNTARMFASATHPDYLELARLPRNIDPTKTSPGALARLVGPERRSALERMYAHEPALTTPGPPDEKEDALRRSIAVDQVRALISACSNKPSLSPRRVILINPADDLERSGANALLKILEEPPAGTIFLLVSHSPGQLLPTIRSRCRLLRFEALSDAQVAGVLRAELPDAGEAEVAALVRAGEGSPGRALRFAGLELAALEQEMAALAQAGDPSNAIRTRLAKLLGTKAAQPRYEAFLARAPSFIAAEARSRRGEALRVALDAHHAARELAGAAIGLTLDAGATAFEMGGLIARLAPARTS